MHRLELEWARLFMLLSHVIHCQVKVINLFRTQAY